jgi:hypothetical protein
MTALRHQAPFAMIAIVGGCATITKDTTQNIAINTPGVAGATCTLTANGATKSIVTPAVLTVARSQQSMAVRRTKECYQDGAVVIASYAEGMTAGNILVGGAHGLGVDAASGAMNHYADDTQMVMTPVHGCKAKA